MIGALESILKQFQMSFELRLDGNNTLAGKRAPLNIMHLISKEELKFKEK